MPAIRTYPLEKAATALADWAAVTVGILVLVTLAVAARGAGLTRIRGWRPSKPR